MSTSTEKRPYVPPITDEELRERNAKAIALLDAWERDGDEQEQRETMAVLRKALGPERMMGYRSVFR
jgi:hypothetical protein